MSYFFIGVLSSVVAVITIWLSRRQFGVLLNFVFFKYYPNVSGKYLWVDIWEPGDGFDAYPNEKTYIYLKQVANSIRGYSEVYSGEELIAKCSIRGTISTTRILRLTSEMINIEHHNYGVSLLKLDPEGKHFTGISVGLCAKCQDTTSNHMKLEKLSQ